jgi:D-sedoheptulose 7-phosphate isomerase
VNETFEQQLEKHQMAIDSVRRQKPIVEQMAETMIDALRRGGRIYLAGNGGSAADSQHIAAELISRLRAGRERPALPGIALTTDTSILTAIGNDYDFKLGFRRQVEGLVRNGDILWALSTSGNSENVLLAADEARKRGAKIIGFAGRTGGKLAGCADLCLCVDGETSDRIQEGHQFAYHLICDMIERAFCA